MANVNLKSLVEKIRDELESLDRQRDEQGRLPLFELEGMDLELKVVVSESTSREGGFDLKVVSAGGSGTQQTESVQTVRLTYRVAPSARSDNRLGTRSHSEGSRLSEPAGVDVLRRDAP